MNRIRDLSRALKNFSMEPTQVKITHSSHIEAQRRRAKSLRLRMDQVPLGTANDHLIASTDAGTHIDAPWHFGRTTAGKPAKKISEVPLEWCYGNGVLLDFSQTRKPGEGITTEDIKKELGRINHSLKPLDIVIIRTGAEEYEEDPRFVEMGSGLIEKSLMWLLDQGIKLIATDAYMLDISIPRMVEELKKGKREGFFPVHYGGREREYIQAVNLCNLRTLPEPTGYRVIMFPIKIEDGAAGWTRAVAIEGGGVLTKMPEIIDLSVPILPQGMEESEIAVSHITHEEGARRFANQYGMSLKLLPTPDLAASDEVSCSSHAATHMDAPWHFGPIVEGKPAKTIDQVPLEWCYNGAMVMVSSSISHARNRLIRLQPAIFGSVMHLNPEISF